MDRKLLEQFENLFLELKKNTLKEMSLEDRNLNWEKGDEVDQSQEERERALDLKLLGRQSFMLKKIDGALFKIKNGTFGICDECEGQIEINRLRARPVATQCISCKEEGERSEGQVHYEKKSHTHGKSFGSNVIPLRTFVGESFESENNILAMNSDH
jgi:DnaK suppressor protein